MKLVKNLAFAGLLVFAITVNTLAGDQQTPNAVPPPPPPPDGVVLCEDGTTSCDPYTGEVTTETDYLFYDALAALLSMY
jgi:hypothetical protein